MDLSLIKSAVNRMVGKKPLVGILFLISFLFQIYLVTKLAFFYPLLKILFLVFILLLLISLFRLPRRELMLTLLCVLIILAFRIPFYTHAKGMMFTSDNALEALQPLEIQDSKRVPFYLLDSRGHNGTLKYLLIAYIWDFLGKDYLTFVLFQLLIFMGVCWLLYAVFRSVVNQKLLYLFLLTNFMFIEVIFDYSLFLRAGPYLEAIFFFLLGVYVFDWEFRHKKNLFLSAYFFLFAIYIHFLSLFLVVPFVLCSFFYAAKKRRLPAAFGLLAAGALAGSFHMLYFMKFGRPLPDTGEWYRIILLNPASLAIAKVPQYLGQILRDFWAIFNNILNFELSFFFQFFKDPASLQKVFFWINRVLVILSLAVLLGGLILSLRRLCCRHKERHWSHLYFVLLAATILGKIFLLNPLPFTEPRHNLDLAFLLLLAYLFVFSELFKIKRLVSLKSATVILLLLVFTVPHYAYFLKMTRFKEDSYVQIMEVLDGHRIKYLNTDFIIAYPIYFFSDRQIQVTDSVGPLTIPFYYPWLTRKVNRIPWQKMAYLLFGEAHFRKSWHIKITGNILARVLTNLKKEKIPYEDIRLEYYTIIIPAPARNLR